MDELHKYGQRLFNAKYPKGWTSPDIPQKLPRGRRFQMLRFDFAVMGTPVGKGRPRGVRVPWARPNVPKTDYESIVGAFCRNMGNRLSTPLSVAIVCYFPIPKSAYWPVNKNHNGELREGMEGQGRTGKPDIDNVAKAILTVSTPCSRTIPR